MLENDGTHNPPFSNLASTPSFQVRVRLGRFWVPPLKSASPDSQPVDNRGANVSTAVAIIFGLLFLRGVFRDSIPLLYFFVLRKSVRVPKMEVVARP